MTWVISEITPTMTARAKALHEQGRPWPAIIQAALDAHPKPQQGLTRRQKQVLDILRKRQREGALIPSVRELQGMVGLKSCSAMHAILNRLQERGYIYREPHQARSIRVLEQ